MTATMIADGLFGVALVMTLVLAVHYVVEAIRFAYREGDR